MKFKSIKNNPPPNGTWVFVRRKDGYILPQQQAYYEAERERLSLAGFVDYCVVPPHILDDPNGWLSEYRGDDLPATNADCVVCTNDRNRGPSFAYFLEEEQRFIHVNDEDVVAYQQFDS